MQIGGGNFRDKTAALEVLACKCDGLIFIGNMAFQIMNALGLPARSEFVEHGAFEGALNIVEFARVNKVGIMFPKDFWCMNDYSPKQLELFPYSDIPDGEFVLFACFVVLYLYLNMTSCLENN